MTNKITNTISQKKYDLEERTAKFGENIIDLTKKTKLHPIMNPIISQLVRAGTSIGANYCEANEADSKKDFNYKIALAKKEAKETMYWLRMLDRMDANKKDEVRQLCQEAHELVLIFSSILRKK